MTDERDKEEERKLLERMEQKRIERMAEDLELSNRFELVCAALSKRIRLGTYDTPMAFMPGIVSRQVRATMAFFIELLDIKPAQLDAWLSKQGDWRDS